MKIGIRAHDLGKSDFPTIVQKAKAFGFSDLQLVLNKAIIDDDGLLNDPKAKEFKKILDDNDIKVAMLGAYFNPVHSNRQKVFDSINKFKNHLDYSSQLGCSFVGTETGSYNDDQWTYNEKNRTGEAYNSVKEVVKELSDYAKDTYVAIEGAFNHVIHSPKLLRKLVDDLHSPRIKVIIDLYNYLDISNYEKRYEIFDEAINLLKERVVIFHLKDFIVENNKLIQVGLGQGLMDFNYLIDSINRNCPESILIFEGVTGADIPTSFEHIKSIVRRCEDGSKQNCY